MNFADFCVLLEFAQSDTPIDSFGELPFQKWMIGLNANQVEYKCKFIRKLARKGFDGLLSLTNLDENRFVSIYGFNRNCDENTFAMLMLLPVVAERACALLLRRMRFR